MADNDGNTNNRFILTEEDMQRIIGFLQRWEAQCRRDNRHAEATQVWKELMWLDSIQPDHVEIDPDADLPEEATR